jgi:hypothetical protein
MSGPAAGRQPKRKAGGSGDIGLACGGDLVQGAAVEAAAKCAVDRWNAERKRRHWTIQPQCGFGSVQLLAQLAEERPGCLAHERSFGCSHGLIRGMAADGCQPCS